MTSLAVLVFEGQGPAYRALNLAGTDPQLEILEIIPLGDEAQVLVKGPKGSLEKWVRSADAKKETLIEEWDSRIEKAFYSLESASVDQQLVFIEGAFLGHLFQAASRALKGGWHVVDLKVPRGSVKWGTLVLTGNKAIQAESDFRSEGLRVTAVSNPTEALKSYFQING